MKRTLGAVFAVAVLATLLVLGTIPKIQVPAVHAAPGPGCTLATLTGSYGFATSSSFFSRTGTSRSLPSADVGVITFDGAGNFSISFTDSSNGVISQNITDTGTYAVNSDCTGTVTFTTGVNFQTVIVSGGKEILAIGTDPGSTIIVDVKKQ